MIERRVVVTLVDTLENRFNTLDISGQANEPDRAVATTECEVYHSPDALNVLRKKSLFLRYIHAWIVPVVSA